MTLFRRNCFCILGTVALTLTVAGCSSVIDGSEKWFPFSKKTNTIPGERISLLPSNTTLTADPNLKDTPVILPEPQSNDSWPSPGFAPDNLQPHAAVSGQFAEVWRVAAGTGSPNEAPLTAPPVVAGGNVYVMDAESHIFAFNASTGAAVWDTPLAPPDEDDPDRGYGGGLAYGGDKLYATSGFGLVLALDPKTGMILWKTPTVGPVHTAPVIAGGRIYAVTRENQLLALDANNGQKLWDHQGAEEPASIIGASSVAVEGQTVVVPYTSGELFALRAENGTPAWNGTLTRIGNTTALTALNDIVGRPVIDRDMVIAVNQSGQFAAFNLVNGEIVWSRDVASIQTPLLIGDFVYLVSTEGQVLCMLKRDGRIKWTSQLPAYDDEEDKTDPIIWSGPLLVSNHLLLVSSDGRAVLLSPFTGEQERMWDLPEGTRVAPIVAGGTIYVLGDDAQLSALR